MKKRMSRVLSLILAVAMLATVFTSGMIVVSADEAPEEIAPLLVPAAPAPTKNSVTPGQSGYDLNNSVHDPEIFYDEGDDMYYMSCTHSANIRKSKDLIHWENVGSFGGNWRQSADDWCGTIGNIRGAFWAPHISYNPVMERYCVYWSNSSNISDGGRGFGNMLSTISMTYMDKVEGEEYSLGNPNLYGANWKDGGIAVRSHDASRYKENVTSGTVHYTYVTNGRADTNSNNASKGSAVAFGPWNTLAAESAPNAIDGTIIWDNDRLYLQYGSFGGGIYLIELDPETGLKFENVAEDDPDYELKTGDGIPLWTRGGTYACTEPLDELRGSYDAGIEGSSIFYHDGYYYITTSYGYLGANYNIRVARSENIEGPYVDANGLYTIAENNDFSRLNPDTIFTYASVATGDRFIDNTEKFANYFDGTEYEGTEVDCTWLIDVNKQMSFDWNIGTKLNGPYQFDNGQQWVAPAHMTMLKDRYDNWVVGYHAKNPQQLHTNVILWTNDGWPLISPTRYTDDDLIDQAINPAYIPGKYELLWQYRSVGTKGSAEIREGGARAIDVVFNEDGTISSDSQYVTSGSWALANDNDITLTVNDVTYTGKIIVGWDWENWKTTFSIAAMSPGTDEGIPTDADGTVIWVKGGNPKKSLVPKVELNVEPVAHLAFDGDLSIESSVGATASANGTVSYVEGIYGQAATITGSRWSDAVRISNGALNNPEEFTVSMWVKPNTLKDHTATFFSRGNLRWMALVPQTYETKTPGVRTCDDTENPDFAQDLSIWNDIQAADGLTLGEWALLTATYADGTLSFYVNGELAGSSEGPNPMNNGSGQTFYIGANEWDGFFDGAIDDVYLYDVALNAKQIAMLQNKYDFTVYHQYGDAEPVLDEEQSAYDLITGTKVTANAKENDDYAFSSVAIEGIVFDEENIFDPTKAAVSQEMGASDVVVTYKYDPALVLDMRFEGNTLDINGVSPLHTSGNAGTLTYEDGVQGQAVRMPTVSGNATSQVIRLKNGTMSNPNAFTISMWVKPDELKGHVATFFSQGSSRWTTMVPHLADTNTVGARIRDDGGNAWYDTAADNALTVGEWAMITLTYSNGKTEYYVDGTKVAGIDSGVVNPMNNGNSQTFYIGGNQWDGSFNGLIDTFQMYRKALSADEVVALYDAQKPAAPVLTAQDIADQIEAGELEATIVDGVVVLPEVEGFELSISASDNEAIIDLEGNVVPGEADTDVVVTVQVQNGEDVASADVTLTVEGTYTKVQEEELGSVYVDLYVDSNDAAAITATYTYDPAVLNYVDIEPYGASSVVAIVDEENGVIKMAYVNGDVPVEHNGLFATIYFTTNEEVMSGDSTTITAEEVQILASDESVLDANLYDVVVNFASNKGDINGDGVATVVDALRVMQYIAGNYELTENQIRAADMDENNEIEVADVMAIMALSLENL